MDLKINLFKFLTTLGAAFFAANSYANTIECYSPYTGAQDPDDSLTFQLDSNGMPTEMVYRFDRVTGKVKVTSKIKTVPEGEYQGDWMVIKYTDAEGTIQTLQFASPEYYSLEQGAKLYFDYGIVESLPGVDRSSTVTINGIKYQVSSDLLNGMNCKQ